MNTSKTLSTKQGRSIVQNKGRLIATRVLKYADSCWKQGKEKEAVDIYTMLMPFILPKLQSIDHNALVDVAVNVDQLRAYIDQIANYRLQFIDDTKDAALQLPAGPPSQDVPAATHDTAVTHPA